MPPSRYVYTAGGEGIGGGGISGVGPHTKMAATGL